MEERGDDRGEARAERVLVAGCGWLGTALGLRLASAGAVVWGLRRRPDGLPDPIRGIGADLAAGLGLGALPEVDAVVYAASADRRDVDAYRAAYALGPRRLLDALRPPARAVFLSSTSVYGIDDGSAVDEDTPAEPDRETARALLDGERAVIEAGGVALRLSGLYGPGRDRLLRSVRDGTARLRPGGPSWTNRVWRDDAVNAVLCALALPEPRDVYVVTDDEPAPWNDVVRGLSELVGRPEPAVDAGAASGGGKRCSNARLRATGWKPDVPTWREGYAALLDLG